MSLAGDWFTELHPESDSAFSLKLKQKVHEEQTPYQKLEIYETEGFGKLMTLDGLIMLTDRDNFIYHEMMTHTALFTHPNPENVLIVGGGDCGSLREVLKHKSVKLVELVELDERVTRVSEKYFPDLCSSNDDPRARFHFTDGIEWVKSAAKDSYDVIIIDSTDPVGPALGLFSEAFYRDCYEALSKQGVLIVQSESPLFHLDILSDIRTRMKTAGYAHMGTTQFPQCSYPSGWWSSTLASKSTRLKDFRYNDAQQKGFPTRYYNADIHKAALCLAQFLVDRFSST